MKDNRIVVDLSKVQWARYGYRNQHGNWRDLLLVQPTVNNQYFAASDKLFMSDNQPITLIDYARDHKLLDIWTPELRLKVTANCILTYTGDKATSLWKEWNRRIFKKK
jgi:hypothetical protein